MPNHLPIFTGNHHGDDIVMAANNAPKHDFAPAWLKIPTQETPVSITDKHVRNVLQTVATVTYFALIDDTRRPLSRF